MTAPIRTALPGDMAEILAIEASVFGPDQQWEAEDLASEVSQGRVIVYTGDPKVVGYAVSKVRDGVGTLTNVAVLPSRQGLGVGDALVTSAMNGMWDAGAACIELECNTDLVSFYRRFRFDVCGFYTTGIGSKQRARVAMRRMP